MLYLEEYCYFAKHCLKPSLLVDEHNFRLKHKKILLFNPCTVKIIVITLPLKSSLLVDEHNFSLKQEQTFFYYLTIM